MGPGRHLVARLPISVHDAGGPNRADQKRAAKGPRRTGSAGGSVRYRDRGLRRPPCRPGHAHHGTGNFLAADELLVHLDLARQWRTLEPDHGLAQLLQDQPGRLMCLMPIWRCSRAAEIPGCACSSGRPPKPQRQRRPGVVQHGPGKSPRSAAHTMRTPRGAAAPQRTPGPPTRRAAKPTWPSRRSQVLQARQLITDPALELHNAHEKVRPCNGRTLRRPPDRTR